MRFPVGTTATLTAEFLDSEGEPLTLDAAPTVKITDPDSSVPELSEAVVDLGASKYEASFVVPTGALLGWYTIHWFAEVGGDPISATANFEIVPKNYVVISNPQKQLRRKLNDDITDEDDSTAFFTNDEIHSLLAMSGQSITAASFEGWSIKAAYYSTLVDVSESGSERKLSQKFRQAQEMVKLYGGMLSGVSALRRASVGRVVARVASLRRDPSDVLGLGWASFLDSDPGVYVRTYPLFRAFSDNTKVGGW